MTMQKADLWIGSLIALLGAVTVYASLKIQVGAGGLLHPRTFPLVIGVLLTLLGLVMSFSAWRRMNNGNKEVNWPGRSGVRSLLITSVSMIFYVSSLEFIGMPLSSLIFVTFLVWYLSGSRLRRGLVAGVITAVLVYLFICGLDVPLPLGPLPM